MKAPLPGRPCVICGEVFWRVPEGPPTGRLADLVCHECAQALDHGRLEEVRARNRLAPWYPEGPTEEVVVFPPGLTVRPGPESGPT